MADGPIGSFWTCGAERTVYFAPASIRGCCLNHKTGDAPHLGNYGPGGSVDIEEMVNLKRAHLAAVRRGEVPDACVGCPDRQKNEWPESPHIFNNVIIGQLTACNTDCYNCESNSNTSPVVVSARAAPRLLPLLKDMVEGGYVDPNATIRFSGGEPTLLRDFEQIVDYVLDVGCRFFVNTSGVKYSPAIERILRNGNPQDRIVISPDAVTPETYRAIKRINVGNRVWENITRYAAIAPDLVEVKYIMLPENWHEASDFIDKCGEIGVRRVSFDIDYRPLLRDGTANSLTDEIIDAIAILILKAKQRAMSVYHSGSGDGTWHHENGLSRLQAAIARMTAGRSNLVIYDTRFVGLVGAPENLRDGVAIDWGRLDNATIVPLKSANAVHLKEDASASVHRIEQTGIAARPGEPHTVEINARAAGRGKLMIEFRDTESRAYTRAKYDLERMKVVDALDDNASIGSLEGDWVRCRLTLTPTSSSAVFNVTLVDEAGSHVYPGNGQAGVHIRPPIVYRHGAEKWCA